MLGRACSKGMVGHMGMPEKSGMVIGPRGLPIYFDRDDSRGRRLATTHGNVNPHSLELWNFALGLRAWDLIVDVGCNYGEMLAGAVMPREAAVIAFEPSVRILPYLRRTLSELPFSVELIEAAVADHVAAEASFFLDTEWSGTSTLADGSGEAQKHAGGEFVSVSMTSLDASLVHRGYRSICMKVDVEGHEADVLKGASKLLDGLDEWALMLEVLHMSPIEISELAERYALYLMDRRTRLPIRINGGSWTLAKKLRSSPWLYGQDALLLSSSNLLKGHT